MNTLLRGAMGSALLFAALWAMALAQEVTNLPDGGTETTTTSTAKVGDDTVTTEKVVERHPNGDTTTSTIQHTTDKDGNRKTDVETTTKVEHGGKTLDTTRTVTYDALGASEEVVETVERNPRMKRTVVTKTTTKRDAKNRQSAPTERTEWEGGTEKQARANTPTKYKREIGGKTFVRVDESGSPATPWRKPARLDSDPGVKKLDPDATPTIPDEESYVPRSAGPGSEIVATFIDPQQSGPSEAVIGLITESGRTQYYKKKTDAGHKLLFTLPTLAGGSRVVAFVLGKGFDANHQIDANAARCEVGTDAVVADADPLPVGIPVTGPAITRGSSAYEQTPGRNIIDLQTRGTNPLTTRVEIDGSTDLIDTRAASNTNVEGVLHANVPLGPHQVSIVSDNMASNAFPCDIITLAAEPVPPSEPGHNETLVVNIEGLGNHRATMTFDVSGAATLADGTARTTVSVAAGTARVEIRGIRAGASNVRFKLHVAIPGYWDLSQL